MKSNFPPHIAPTVSNAIPAIANLAPSLCNAIHGIANTAAPVSPAIPHPAPSPCNAIHGIANTSVPVSPTIPHPAPSPCNAIHGIANTSVPVSPAIPHPAPSLCNAILGIVSIATTTILARIALLLLLTMPYMALSAFSQPNMQRQSPPEQHSSSDDDDDPCIDPDDKRICWTQDPITGIHFMQVPDTTHINLGNRQTMAGKSLGLVYTGNLYSPHHIGNLFDQHDAHDFLFVNAYDLFAYRPEDMLFYDTRIPFTNVSYMTSGSSRESNDHLKINFAGNLNNKLGLGTFLDYVYARGEYISQATKPLKWSSYIYYNDDLYKASLTFNLSKLANQENGGIQDSSYVLTPDKYDATYTDPGNIPVNLNNAWNDMNALNLHFTHSYDLGKWHEVVNEEDSTDVWDEFTSYASIFHSFDLQTYDHLFRMDANAIQHRNDSIKFYPNHFINDKITQDSSAFMSLSTYAGIRLNEGFNKWSQFGISAFVGFEHQEYSMLHDNALNIKDQNNYFVNRKHISNNLFVGGQLSRQQSSFLTFDINAKLGLSGDKLGDVDINGSLQTVLPAGRNDSITVQASGYIRNQNVSYMMNHYYSNHIRWDRDFKQEQRVHLQGLFRYSLTGTEIKVGMEHISNYHYFKAHDFHPYESSNQIELLSTEITQRLHWKAIHFDNRLLLQSSTHEEELAVPKFVWETDLSLRFVIAHTLTTQLGCTGYYFGKYYAPKYQPATQQFAAQNYRECGDYGMINAYVNCNLKRIKFYVMYSGQTLFTKNVFIMPDYPMQSTRVEYGVVFDLQD